MVIVGLVGGMDGLLVDWFDDWLAGCLVNLTYVLGYSFHAFIINKKINGFVLLFC